MESVKSLVSLEFRSIVKGYEFLASLNTIDLPFFEIWPQAPGKLTVLAGGSHEETQKFWELTKRYQKNLLAECFLPKCATQILPALYGQQKPKIFDLFGVAQTKTLSHSLMAVNAILAADQSNSYLLEIDSGRSLGGPSVFYFTAKENAKKEIEKALKKQKINLQFTLFSKNSALSRRYFQLA